MHCTDACTCVSSHHVFLRHAYNQFYHDFSNVDLKGTNFYWCLTFSSAFKTFRLAALRHGMQHRTLYTTRVYTNLVQEAPMEARQRFASVVDVDRDGVFCLEQPFVAAVDAAEKEADDWLINVCKKMDLLTSKY